MELSDVIKTDDVVEAHKQSKEFVAKSNGLFNDEAIPSFVAGYLGALITERKRHANNS